MRSAALAKTVFFFPLPVACSAVFLETRDTSATVALDPVFALALHEKPSLATSVSSSAGFWEQLRGTARRKPEERTVEMTMRELAAEEAKESETEKKKSVLFLDLSEKGA